MGSKPGVLKWSQQITPAQVVRLMRTEKDLQKARMIFDSATAEYAKGFRHDHTSFGHMIARLVSANQFRAAEAILDRTKQEKCIVNEDIFLTICRGYGRVHRALDAVRVFRKMKDFNCDPTQKSYITVFAILVEENQLKLALRFYRYMREVGIPVSVMLLNILIKGLCRNIGTIEAAFSIFREMPNRGCVPDSFTYGTLINGLCRFGRINEAKLLFKEMKAKECPASVVTYTSLIHGLCESKKVDEALGLLVEMKSEGIEPNVVTYSSLMCGLCNIRQPLQAMELFERMVSKGCKPNMITYSTLINGLCKEEKFLEAVELLDRMKLQGLKPDAGLYGKVICGFCNLGKFHEAANFVDEMVLGGVTPSRLTWSIHVRVQNMVVLGLCERDLNRAHRLYLGMRTRGISVEPVTSNSLVRCFCEQRNVNIGAQIINDILIDGCAPDIDVWRKMLHGILDNNTLQRAMESFSKLYEPMDIEEQRSCYSNEIDAIHFLGAPF